MRKLLIVPCRSGDLVVAADRISAYVAHGVAFENSA